MNRAVGALQEVAGPSYPMLFLKLGDSNWDPVGDEMLQKLIPGKNESAAIVICDADGNSKAMSGWLAVQSAEECSRKLVLKGVPVYSGEVKLPI